MLGKANNNKKPTYDIVDEYVKSLEEYRYQKEPNDEDIANIVLEISDFLLEFATLGHELQADVPNNCHPVLPNDDLKQLGVPYVDRDDDGRSTLIFPNLFTLLSKKTNNIDDGYNINNNDTLIKALDDVPLCTTYFFQRWLWIQYPYIALGNCNNRYEIGIIKNIQENSDGNINGTTIPGNGGIGKGKYSLDSIERPKTSNGLSLGNLDPLLFSATLGSSTNPKRHNKLRTKTPYESARVFTNVDMTVRLPQLPYHRKAARSMRKVPGANDNENVDELAHKMINLQDDIQNYRNECDYLGQLKSTYHNKLAELKGQLADLKRTEEATHLLDNDYNDMYKRENETSKKVDSVKMFNRNLKNLVVMCERHPPNYPAIILELQTKVKQDEYLLKEIKKRLWEQKFEKQTHDIYYKEMKELGNVTNYYHFVFYMKYILS